MPNFTVCANETEPLLKEAFYSFEHDIKVHIGNLNAQSEQIYGQWFYPTLKNKLDVKEFVSPHTVKVFEMLKESKPEIWDVYNEDSNLNYKSDFIKCIAANMIDKARKLDIYDSLIVGDIVEKLELLEEKYDLFVALDVFIYIGEPTAFFNAVRKCCNKNSLFIFSIETQEDEGYSLLKSSRYAHSDNYILDVASNGFTLVDSQNVKLRKEGNNWIDGKIYILKVS